jgi:uncharacterized repeat protein (TIGR01451 family)
VHRRRLHTALLMLGIGLAFWASQVLGQGEGPDQKTPRIIATAQPLNAKPAAVKPKESLVQAPPKTTKIDDLPLDNEVPPVPEPPSIPPVVPLPDDGLTPAPRRPPPRRLQLRDLPPDAHSIRDATSTTASTVMIGSGNVKPAVFVVPHNPLTEAANEEGSSRRRIDGSLSQPASAPLPDSPSFPKLRPSPALEPSSQAIAEGPRTAKVTVEVSGPSSSASGQTYAYAIVVRNAGPAAAEDVQVSEVVLAGARYLKIDPQPSQQEEQLVWDLGVIQAGEEKRIAIQVLPPAEGEIVSKARATFATRAALRTRIGSSSLTISAQDSEPVALGGTVRVPIKVTNTMRAPVAHVKLQALLVKGLQHPSGARIEADAGSLGAGESRTFSLEIKAVQPGDQVVRISAQSDDSPAVSTQAHVRVAESSLQNDSSLQILVKGPAHSPINQETEYRIEVVNAGAGPVTGLKLTMALPLGLDFSEADGATHSPAARLVEWSLSSLPAGNTWNTSLKLRGKTAGERLLQTLVQADRNLKARTTTHVRIEEGASGLTLDVEARDDPLEVGAETVYEIRVVNQGDAPCTNVSIIALAPEGLKPTQADGPTNQRLQKQQITFEPLAQLASHAEAKYRIHVKGQRPGDWRFKVQLSCDQLQRPVTREEATHVYND